MATNKRKNNQITKKTASSSGTGHNDKRQRTRSATITVSVKQEPEEEGAKKKEHDNDNVSTQPVTVSPNNNPKNDDDDDNARLPTRRELSKELCRIVDLDTYSWEQALATLKKLSKWLKQQDLDFLKSFHLFGGGVKVLDFLTSSIDDVNCKGKIRSRCIGWAASVISSAVFCVEDNHGNTEDTVTKIHASIVDYDGINTLINASEEYIGGDDFYQLYALWNIWGALRNISALDSDKKEISKEQAIAVFETGIDVMFDLKTVDTSWENCPSGGRPKNLKKRGLPSNCVLEHVFCTLNSLVHQGYLTTEYCIQNKTIVGKCLDVFKKNEGTWIDRGEAVTKWATSMFICCYNKRLLCDSDYEILLPFYAYALKQHAANKDIRNHAIGFFSRSCAAVHDKNIIKQSGVMELLAVVLGSNEIDNDNKKKVGVLIGKIAALVL